MFLKEILLAGLRRLQTRVLLLGKSKFLAYGPGLHIGQGTRLWAPKSLRIGSGVYIGKHVHIEANCEIGDYCLLANRVAIIGRHDHDFSAIGFPFLERAAVMIQRNASARRRFCGTSRGT